MCLSVNIFIIKHVSGTTAHTILQFGINVGNDSSNCGKRIGLLLLILSFVCPFSFLYNACWWSGADRGCTWSTGHFVSLKLIWMLLEVTYLNFFSIQDIYACEEPIRYWVWILLLPADNVHIIILSIWSNEGTHNLVLVTKCIFKSNKVFHCLM